MTKREIKNEIKKALEKGFVCTDWYICKTQYPIVFAEPKGDGGYVNWLFNPETTYLDGSHWLEGFFADEPLPTAPLTYKQVCYRLKLDNPIKHFLKEMLVKGKNLFNKKEKCPFTKLEGDDDDIF